jgi:hypothetical protein
MDDLRSIVPTGMGMSDAILQLLAGSLFKVIAQTAFR